MEKMIDKIPEIKNARNHYHALKRNLNKERRKIKSLYEKHFFVNMITSKDVDDFELEDYISQLFQDLTYHTNKPSTKNRRDLDVIVSLNSRTIGIEVKNGNFPSENDMFQARKYAIRYLKKNKQMHPQIVWNNVKTNQEFDSSRIEDVEGNFYGIITTKELLKGYLKVKQKIIDLNTFDNLINKTGLIKFSNSVIRKIG